MTPSQRLWGERNLLLSTPILHYFGDMFVPGLGEEGRRDPDISPLYADLRDLPPALFTVGTMDPLLDDSLFMHARWRASGARAELRTWPEAIHGFNAMPLRVTAAARAEQYAFLREAVSGGVGRPRARAVLRSAYSIIEGKEWAAVGASGGVVRARGARTAWDRVRKAGLIPGSSRRGTTARSRDPGSSLPAMML